MKNSVLCFLEKTVENSPDKVALVDETNEITFREIKEKALCITKAIMEKKSIRRAPVLVYLPKNAMSIVSFMGILYSGNFYTPTDVRFPDEKLKSIVDCLQPELVITDSAHIEKLKKIGIDENILIDIDTISWTNSGLDSAELLEQIIDTDPVYVFFTSGSTGVPKGVIINNYNIIDYTEWAQEKFHINEHTVMGNQSPFYFDISTQDIFTTLSSGATLVIIPVQYFAFPVKALQFINEKNVNFLYWVPSAFVNISILKLLEKVHIDQVHTMMFGGEVMPVKHLNYWKRHLPNLKLISNVYGPTEATVNCTYYIVDREFEDDESLPLSRACENTDLLVLDEEDRLVVDADQLGELCVRGSSLALGYWKDPEKTAQMFVQNPLNQDYPEKIYRTGDLVYYDKRGEIRFAGRKDFQIKHMGYRIELGEIETAALSLNGIESVCAMYHEKEQQIALFYMAKKDLEDADVKKALVEILPKYMVPTLFYRLKTMPYNDNGKIDRIKLKSEYLTGLEV